MQPNSSDTRQPAPSNPTHAVDLTEVLSQEDWIRLIRGQTEDMIAAGRPEAEIRAEYVATVVDLWTHYGVEELIARCVAQTLLQAPMDTVTAYLGLYRFAETIGVEYMEQACAKLNAHYAPEMARREAEAARLASEASAEPARPTGLPFEPTTWKPGT